MTGTIHAAIARHAAVVSISGSHGEHLFTPAEVARLHAALLQAAARHITVVASSGDTGVISDNGPPVQVSLPARTRWCWAARGTALNASIFTGAYHGEMAWNADTEASAGGYSSCSAGGLPGQRRRIGRMRGVPTSPPTPTPPRHGADVQRRRPLPSPGNQRRHPAVGGRDRPGRPGRCQQLGFVDPAIYAIARSPAYQRAFHDVIVGDNSVFWPTGIFSGYQAGPGWDPVTGWTAHAARLSWMLSGPRSWPARAARPAGRQPRWRR